MSLEEDFPPVEPPDENAAPPTSCLQACEMPDRGPSSGAWPSAPWKLWGRKWRAVLSHWVMGVCCVVQLSGTEGQASVFSRGPNVGASSARHSAADSPQHGYL